jgi:uncharacterized RDD family membrane protein YckC
MKNSVHFWSRAMAFIIDMTLLFFFTFTLIFYVGELIIVLSTQELEGIIKGLGVFLVISPGVFLMSIIVYFTLLHSWGGKTLGKFFMGIKVESTRGQSLSPGNSFLRFAGYFLSALPLGVGFLWVILDKKHDAWHDKLADTRVVFD